MAKEGGEVSTQESEEALLYAARHGEIKVVRDLLNAREEGKLSLDISCKGKSKSNLGWTPLHLATYFNHAAVVNALLDAGADVDAANDLGDTPLHKAAYIGREELVAALLAHGADVSLLNGEGRAARDVCRTRDVHRLLAAAELAGRRARERRLLAAAREGQLELIHELLTESQPPSMNCVDEQGNTALHCAAYRGHAQVAVLLLQNGIDSTIRNNNGKLASELARDSNMREVLSVRPARRLQRTAASFEGPLLRRSRFLGWRPVWAVLQRGVLVYYGSRGEAAAAGAGDGRGRRDRKYLDGAAVRTPPTEPALLHLTFSDGDSHRLCVPPGGDVPARRQEWVTAFNEHVAYSGHYLWAGGRGGGGGAEGGVEAGVEAAAEDEEGRPLGSLQDALGNAANALALLDSQLNECAAIVSALDKSVQVGSTLHQSAYMRFQHVYSTGQRSLSLLRHASALVAQAREADAARLRTQSEKSRVLEEALAALARQHHRLEMSLAEELHASKRSKKNRSSRTTSASDVNFYDAYDGESDSDTLVTAGLHSPLGALSPWETSPEGSPLGGSGDLTPTGEDAAKTTGLVRPTRSSDAVSSMDSLHTALSAASSLGTLVSQDGHVYRNARTHVGTYRPSSQWSL